MNSDPSRNFLPESGTPGDEFDPLFRRLQEQEERIAFLEAENARLRTNANEDELTSIASRRGLIEKMNELKQAGIDFAVVSYDVTKFKFPNDEAGQTGGDIILQFIAKHLEHEARKDVAHHDIIWFGAMENEVGRLGGDEFVAILPLDNPREDSNLTSQQRGEAFLERSITNFWNHPDVVAYNQAAPADKKLALIGSVAISEHTNPESPEETLRRAEAKGVFIGPRRSAIDLTFIQNCLGRYRAAEQIQNKQA